VRSSSGPSPAWLIRVQGWMGSGRRRRAAEARGGGNKPDSLPKLFSISSHVDTPRKHNEFRDEKCASLRAGAVFRTPYTGTSRRLTYSSLVGWTYILVISLLYLAMPSPGSFYSVVSPALCYFESFAVFEIIHVRRIAS